MFHVEQSYTEKIKEHKQNIFQIALILTNMKSTIPPRHKLDFQL